MEVGAGKFTYEVAEGWGKLPQGWKWGQIASVATDSQDRVYLYTRTDHPVMVFDRDGVFLKSWGEGMLKEAHGIRLDAQDNMYLVDRVSHVVMKFTAAGQKVFELGNRDQPSDTGYTEENPTVLRAAEPFNVPTDVALSGSGDFYVSDGYRNARIHKFSSDGTLLFSWGEPGAGPGQFNLPHGVWEAQSRVYVADRANDRIQVFTPRGEHLETWPGFLRPNYIFIDHDDIMYVTELPGRVSILDLNGTVLARMGDPKQPAPDPGKFVAPHGIWADSHGDLYVSEVLQGQRIQKFIRKR